MCQSLQCDVSVSVKCGGKMSVMVFSARAKCVSESSVRGRGVSEGEVCQ